MTADTVSDAYKKGKSLAFGSTRELGPPAPAPLKEDGSKSRWRDEWNKERSVRDMGFVCSRCAFFRPETDHPLSGTFPDLGMCQKTGSHRFGSASCSMGRWEGRRRPGSASIST
jgi:hypothetical protein